MDRSASSVRVGEIEQALSQVSGIEAARVVAGPEGQILEIHVLALPTKSPKNLVRDIESTLMARFALPVDHRKISIAQLDSERADEAPAVAGGETVRPRVVSINASVTGVHAAASVTLRVGDEEYVGTASGPSSRTSRSRQIAEAALEAANKWAAPGTTFALEDVAVVQLGRQKVAVACVTQVTPFGEQVFSGSALMRQNESDTIVRATLDAINRRFGHVTTA